MTELTICSVCEEYENVKVHVRLNFHLYPQPMDSQSLHLKQKKTKTKNQINRDVSQVPIKFEYILWNCYWSLQTTNFGSKQKGNFSFIVWWSHQIHELSDIRCPRSASMSCLLCQQHLTKKTTTCTCKCSKKQKETQKYYILLQLRWIKFQTLRYRLITKKIHKCPQISLITRRRSKDGHARRMPPINR